MVRVPAILTVLLFLSHPAGAQDTIRLQLIFTGDIMGHDSQIESAYDPATDRYDYSSYFRNLPELGTADITLGNLEVNLAGPPYKGYPQFSSPDALAISLKEAGFDILVNANNHALDRRKKGLERTHRILDSLDLIHTGTFRDSLERAVHYPLIFEKKGVRFALLNYSYGTNGLTVQPPNIVNYIDTTQIAADIEKARLASPDLLIAFMHWGNEYERTENRTQRELARFLLAHGTDVIIGSHPHVVQPIERSPEGKLIVWSMGNLISNQRERYRNGGIIVSLEVEKNPEQTFVKSSSYLPVYVCKPVEGGKTVFTLTSDNHLNGEPSDLSSQSVLEMKLFIEDTVENIPGYEADGSGWYKEKPGEAGKKGD
ncbi:MAG: CapA family protein [Bacteroidota bacterium]